MNRPRSPIAWRPVDGILLLDKPGGMSSNQALQLARRRFTAEKGGHTGSLDPLATGMLPLCFGEATKIAGLLLSERKAYLAEAQLGTETDTCDSDGTPTAQHVVAPIDAATLERALAPLRGRIRQVPPEYSAIKRDGEPAYRRVRRGETVEMPAREVEVFALQVEQLAPDRLRLRIECGSGTYVRSLVRDLGRALGCGAHVTALRRLWVDPFRDAPMFTLQALDAAQARGTTLESLLLPIEAGLVAQPRVELDADAAARFRRGQALAMSEAGVDRQCVAYGPDGLALGLAAVRAGELRPQRQFYPDRVMAAEG